MPLLNVARITLLNHVNRSYLPGDEDLVHLTPPHPPSNFFGPSSSSQQPYPNYGELTTPLDPFKRGEPPLEPMSHLSMPPFMILSKSGMMNFGR